MTDLSGANLNSRKAAGPQGEGRNGPSHFPRYPEYKDSDVEWLSQVPAHWEVVRLRRIVRMNPSKREISDIARDTEVSFVPMEAVGAQGSLDLSRTRQISEVENGYTYFRDGDVTFAKITPCFENGKGALMRGLEQGIGFGTTELTVVRTIEGLSIPAFIDWLFRSPGFRLNGEASMYGAGGQKRVPDDFVREFQVAIPPIDEQIKLAAFLGSETRKIDGLIAEQEKLIALLKEKRQAVISHAVTKGLNPNVPMKDSDIEWLGTIPAHWNMKRLKNISPFITVGVVVNPSDYVSDEGLPFIYGGDIREGEIDISGARKISPEDSARNQKTKLSSGDLLTVRVGAPGVTAVVPPECEGGNCASVMLMRKGKYDSKWLCYAMNSPIVRFQVAVVQYGAAQEQFNISHAINFWVAVPPHEEQSLISDRLDAEIYRIDDLICEAEKGILLLQEHRSALISAAVTGKIDVRNYKATEAA